MPITAAPFPQLGNGFALRSALPSDHDALCAICLATGDAGRDATAREDDPRLIGMIYAVPYQVLSPDFAFVIEGDKGPAGYLLGTPDSALFNRQLARDWYPALRKGLRDPGPDRSAWRGSDWARHAVHRGPAEPAEALQAYPAHGHIDLLPEARGKGIGRRCITLLEARLADSGAAGLHLEVHPENHGAQAFYRKLGYAVLPEAARDDALYMVKRLGR